MSELLNLCEEHASRVASWCACMSWCGMCQTCCASGAEQSQCKCMFRAYDSMSEAADAPLLHRYSDKSKALSQKRNFMARFHVQTLLNAPRSEAHGFPFLQEMLKAAACCGPDIEPPPHMAAKRDTERC